MYGGLASYAGPRPRRPRETGAARRTALPGPPPLLTTMPSLHPLSPLWVGDPAATTNAAVLHALARALGAPVRRVPHVQDASEYFAVPAPLVIFDARCTVDWREAISLTLFAAPHSAVIGWDPDGNSPALESALLAGADEVCGGQEGEDAAAWARIVRRARARAAVRQRTVGENGYRAFFERTPLPSAMLDAKGRIVAHNGAFRGAFGDAYAPSGMRSIFDLFTPESLALEAVPVRSVIAGETDFHSAELCLTRVDGAIRWHALTIFAMPFGDHAADDPVVILGAATASPRSVGRRFVVIQDITDRKAADAEIRERERFFQAVFQHAGVGIAVMQVGETHMRFNPALQRMFDAPPVVTGDYMVVLTHPEDRMLDAALFHELFSGRRDTYQVEKRYVHPTTGDVVDGLLTASLQRDEQGGPRALFGTVVDITERKRAESAVRESETRFRAFFEHAAVGMAVVDVASGVVEINPAMQGITGAPTRTPTREDVRRWAGRPDATGQSLLDMIGGVDALTVCRAECEFSRPDGEVRCGDLTVAASGGDERPRTLFLTLEDVTERKRAADDLVRARAAAEAANRAKSAFLATMTHELRTPMNGVVGMAQLLETAPLDDEHRGYVATLLTCADQTLTLINEVLELSKLEAGRVELETRPFDPRRLVEDTIAVVAPQGAAKGLRLVTAIEPGVPREVVGDAHRVRQVLLNYLSNAIKFTPSGTITATVSATPRDGAFDLQFAVRDTGIGIPADRVDRLFQMFSQVDVSTTREYGGTGLGLAISKRLAELMGGRVWVESTDGAGSTFYFTGHVGAVALPPARLPAVPAAPTVESGLRILVADDNAVNRLVASKMLERLGIRADLAEDGREAVERVAAAATAGVPYHLVLMDVRMPGMDGVEATRAIRARLPGDASPRIMAFSANALAEDREAYLAAGMDGHLVKPAPFAELRRVVEDAIERAGLAVEAMAL